MASSPSSEQRRLVDLGELRLIDEVIVPLAKRFENSAPLGDDCAILTVKGVELAITADVGPKPAIQTLPGHEQDFESAGWHAAVATASDVATAGAKPLFMTNCIDAPPDLEVATLEAFVTGLFRAYKELGFRNAGGDIRHGPTLAARITGVGLIEHAHAVGRDKASIGDRFVLIGRPGRFMAAYLLARVYGSASLSKSQLDWLRFPRPMLSEMALLCQQGLIRSASDSSDGVLGAIDNICRRSGCGLELELDRSLFGEDIIAAAEAYGCDPWNVFFCWGDWSVVAVVPEALFAKFNRVASEARILFTPLGRVVAKDEGAHAVIDAKRRALAIVRNENFLSRGFNAGIAGHLEYMLKTPLFGKVGL